VQPVGVGHAPVGAVHHRGEGAGDEQPDHGRDQRHGEAQQSSLKASEDGALGAVGYRGGPVGAQRVVEADGAVDGAPGPPAGLLAPHKSRTNALPGQWQPLPLLPTRPAEPLTSGQPTERLPHPLAEDPAQLHLRPQATLIEGRETAWRGGLRPLRTSGAPGLAAGSPGFFVVSSWFLTTTTTSLRKSAGIPEERADQEGVQDDSSV
jgi:hypothetical protein